MKKGMPHYDDKFEYLANKQKWICPISQYCHKPIMIDKVLHHYRVHNDKYNRKKYPLLLNSMLNLMPVNNDYHLAHPSFGGITDYQADKIERFLEKHPRISSWVNNPQGNINE